MWGAPQWTTDAKKYGEHYCIHHGTEREQRFAPKHCLNYVSFCPEGKRLITASGDKTSRIYDPEKGCNSRGQIRRFRQSDVVRCANWTHDGEMVCTGADDGNPRVYSVSTGEELYKFGKDHDRMVTFCTFSPDSKLLMSAHWDRSCRIWDLAAEQHKDPLHRLKHTDSVLCARFSHDGMHVCTASGAPRFNGLASIYDMETSEVIASMEQEDSVTSCSFSADRKLLCTSSRDRTARVIDLNTQLATMQWQHPNFVRSACLSPDGRYVCSACDDGQARIFCTRTRAELLNFAHVDQVTSASFSPDGTRIVTSSQDGGFRVFGTKPSEPKG